MTHGMFKIQRQEQRESAAADGTIAAVIIIVLALVMLMIFTAPARASEFGVSSSEFGVKNPMQDLAHETAERMEMLRAASEKAATETDAETTADLMKARQAVAEIRALTFGGAIKNGNTNRWTAGDTALQALFLTTLAVDRAQTVSLRDHNLEEVMTARHFIGAHPSSGQANRYFATCALLHTTIAVSLPKEMEIGSMTIYPRAMWQSFWIGAEISTIDRNIGAGISVRF